LHAFRQGLAQHQSSYKASSYPRTYQLRIF
jgi:hypothetical protein